MTLTVLFHLFFVDNRWGEYLLGATAALTAEPIFYAFIVSILLIAVAVIAFRAFHFSLRNISMKYYTIPMAVLLILIGTAKIQATLNRETIPASLSETSEPAPHGAFDYDVDPVRDESIQEGIEADQQLLACVLSGNASSPASTQVEMAALYEANLRKNLFKNGSIVHAAVSCTDSPAQLDAYFTPEAYYERQPNYWSDPDTENLILYTETQTCNKTFSNKKEEFTYVTFFMPADDFTQLRGALDEHQPLPERMLDERLVSSAFVEGGYLCLETELELDTLERCEALLPVANKLGATCCKRYLIDPQTLMVLEMEISLEQPDGSVTPYSVTSFEYLSELPEELQDLQDELTHLGKDNPRTITVRYDPQTADEQVFSVRVNADTLVRSYFLPGYDLFLDAQGQKRLETFEGEGDLVIYALPEADGQSE